MLESFLMSSSFHIVFTLLIAVITMLLYIINYFSIEAISFFSIGSLLLFFQIDPMYNANHQLMVSSADILSGFSNPALITIISLIVMSRAVSSTGIFSIVTRKLTAVKIPKILMISLIFLMVFVASGFLNNVPVVLLFIPILTAVLKEFDIPNSKYMMILSFVSILGGTLTIIGSSTNILIAESFTNLSSQKVDFYTTTKIAITLSIFLLIFLFVFGTKLLPKKGGLSLDKSEDKASHINFDIYFYLDHNANKLIGSTVTNNRLENYPNIVVKGIKRRKKNFKLYKDYRLKLGDRLIINATTKNFRDFLTDIYAKWADYREHQYFAELLVTPTSYYINKKILQDKEGDHQLKFMGISRLGRSLKDPYNVSLKEADILLVTGILRDIRAFADLNNMLLLNRVSHTVYSLSKMLKAGIIFIGVILLMSTSVLPPITASVIGVLLMFFTKVLSFRKVMGWLDTKIIALIVSSFAIGVCIKNTGSADIIANYLISALQGYTPIVIVSVVFALISIFTNFLSNQVTAIIFAPIVYTIAIKMNLDINIMVITLILAANNCFAVPTGYQTNLLVMGVGEYKFIDYIKLGLPMSLLMWFLFTVFMYFYYI